MSRKKSERELQQIQQNLEYQTWELKVFLADVVSVDISKNENLEDRMIELENLMNCYFRTYSKESASRLWYLYWLMKTWRNYFRNAVEMSKSPDYLKYFETESNL